MNILMPTFYFFNYVCTYIVPTFSTILHVYVAIFFVTVANLVQGTSSHTYDDDGMVRNAIRFLKMRLVLKKKIQNHE